MSRWSDQMWRPHPQPRRASRAWPTNAFASEIETGTNSSTGLRGWRAGFRSGRIAQRGHATSARSISSMSTSAIQRYSLSRAVRA
jgi:hypothetical protein